MFSYFESLIKPFPDHELDQPPSSLYRFCRYYTRGIEFHVIVVAVLTAIIAILEMVLYSFLGQLVDWLNSKDPETFFQQEQWFLVGMALLVLIVKPGISWLQSMFIHQTLLGNYPMSIRWLAHRYLLDQSWSFYQDDFAGRLATKVMQTALSIRETVLKFTDVFVYVGVYFVSMVFLIGSCDLRLMIPVLVWLTAYVVVLRHFIPRLRQASATQADARAEMTGRIVDSYTNIGTVKLFSHSGKEAAYAREGMERFLNTVHPQMRLVTKLEVSIYVINSLLIFGITLLSIYLWQTHAVSAGAIAVSLALALRVHGISQWIMWEVSSLFENMGTVQDGMSTLSKPQDVLDTKDAKPLEVTAGMISFENIGFDYGKGEPVFDGLSLRIAPGERVGIVGRSGAGKSTLVNLLLRLFDLQGGCIRIDGQDISGVTQRTLRAAIGMVTQDTSLLHRSVRENILYGKPGCSEAEMIQAAKKAEAHEYILKLRDLAGRSGYDAYVGERGVKLSGGQRQRIAIARVLLKNAPILVLDEATSALDSEVELAIQNSLDGLMKGKTVIAIAHRLSTIASMDRLVVLDQGRIVEEGTHEELVRSNGLYSQLWEHQSGGFIGLE